MMFALGPLLHNNTAAVAGPGGTFTPASVTGLDLWVEAGDLTTLYTDLGSTHAAVDGDIIEQWNDKSTAARNLTQTVLANRPLYKTDLAKPSLLFDGTNDSINSASALTWLDGSGQHWFAISAQTVSTASTRELAVITSSGGGYVGDIYINTSVHMEIQNAAAGFEEDAQSGIVSGTPFVAIGTATTTQLEAFVDNVSGAATALSGVLRTNTGTFVAGGQSTSFNGRIFGLCHGQGVLSSTDRGNLQTYLAALHP